MGKIVQSPVKRWPGQVVISDPLTFPQLLAWRTAIDNARDAGDSVRANAALIPGIIACVEQWQLGGDFPASVTAETFPSSPVRVAVALIGALTDAISAVMIEEDDYPNS